MSIPILYHDPSSEPSRAVHWLAVEAGLELDIEFTWLTRGGHRAPAFLEINPAHQVPAMVHGDFRLAEASAIMLYLADLHGIRERWVGATAEERAWTQRFLSWHHTNTRQITLNYFLPVLLMPAYHGDQPPAAEDIARLRANGRESLELLDRFLRTRGAFAGGDLRSVADLFIASDLFALDLDPERATWFEGLPAVSAWLDRLRESQGYAVSHGPWNAIIERLRTLLAQGSGQARDCNWVADAMLAAQ